MQLVVANESHIKFAKDISETIQESAKVRGTGIALRSPEYIIQRMKNGNAIIALDGERFAGFCYIEVWGNKDFVANSGLIVHPDFRGLGLAKKIKRKIFDLSREKFPEAKIFSITTGLAVMKMNYELGYRPVTFSELTNDPEFWKGCQTCKNFDVLNRTQMKMCLCTGQLYDPKEKETGKAAAKKESINGKAFRRLKSIKEKMFLKRKQHKKNT